MRDILKIFKDVLPTFIQPKSLNEPIGFKNIPEYHEVDNILSEAGVIGSNLSVSHLYQSIQQLILHYRNFSQIDFVDEAIDEIVNEAIVIESNNPVVSLDLDMIDWLSENIKKKVYEEFEYVKELLDFDNKADELFREWYIDGRKYQQYIYNKNTKKGLLSIHNISPFKILRIWDEKTHKYWYYIEPHNENVLQNVKLDKRQLLSRESYLVSEDHINFIPSGVKNPKQEHYLSYLHRAIKPANQLILLEDSMVVYRFTRSPERRAFYIDIGRMGKTKADEYVKKLMNKFKTRLNYDTSTGTVNQKKSVMTMLEDYWLPRMGSKGTEVQTLSGGQQLGEISDIQYMKRRVWKALKIPASRADEDNPSMISFGDDSLNREELKFHKRVINMRKKFQKILLDPLRIQCLSKKIMTVKEWKRMERKIRLLWNEDSYWSEMKDNSILNNRLDTLDRMQEHKGKYFSDEWIKKNVLKQDENDIEVMKKQMDKENEENPPENDEE